MCSVLSCFIWFLLNSEEVLWPISSKCVFGRLLASNWSALSAQSAQSVNRQIPQDFIVGLELVLFKV